MNIDDALELLKKKRHDVDPIPAFIEQAKQWERMIRKDDTIQIDRKLTPGNKKALQSPNSTNDCGESSEKKSTNTLLKPSKPIIGPIRPPPTQVILDEKKRIPPKEFDQEDKMKKRRITGPNKEPIQANTQSLTKTTSIGPHVSSTSSFSKNCSVLIGPSLPTSISSSSGTRDESKLKKCD